MSAHMSEDQRVAVITGGAGGIGSAIVEALRRSGHRTVVIDRVDADVVCDLASEQSTRDAAAEVLRKYGRCDVLVHCAGTHEGMEIGAVERERWRRVMAVNVEAALWLAEAFTPGMVERGFGRIVLISSDGQWAPPSPDFLAYVTSKAALHGLMRNLAVAFGGDGISVMGVAPGLTDTPLSRGVVGEGPIEAVVSTQALKRRLVPQDTANVVAFLASDGAEALTGQVLVVNGGAVMR